MATRVPLASVAPATTARFAAPKSTTEDYGGGWDEWQPEELVAMVLTYAKDITRAPCMPKDHTMLPRARLKTRSNQGA